MLALHAALGYAIMIDANFIFVISVSTNTDYLCHYLLGLLIYYVKFQIMTTDFFMNFEFILF